jgi:group I intron endonuclease
MIFIYKITNLINNKIYIGQTSNPSGRWSKHKSAASKKYGKQLISRAIHKYGVDNFIFEVIASCLTSEDANQAETAIIKQYDSRNLEIGYNVDVGGKVFPPKPEVIKKISKSLKEYYLTHSNKLKGKKMPESWKINLSRSSIGKLGTNRGKKFSKEWRDKISSSTLGKSKKGRRKFSEQVEKEICRLYSDQSLSTYKLAKAYDCDRSLIISILRRHNIDMRHSSYTKNLYKRNKFNPEQELEICKLYLYGNHNKSDLARKYKCRPNVITAILFRNKILGA